MELRDFTEAVARLSAPEIHRLACDIQAQHATAAADVAWWQATITIERSLKALGRTRQAATAATVASRAVQTAAVAGGVRLPDVDVTCVARAAADVARGLCAGGVGGAEVDLLLGVWTPILAGHAPAIA